MQVAVKSKWALLGKLQDQFLGMIDCWVQNFTRVLPPSVEITTSQRTSIVAVDYTVRVQHWDNLEDELVSQLMRYRIAADEEIYNSFHHPGRVWLTRVDSWGNNNSFFEFVNLIRHSVCYCQVLALVAGQSSTKDISCHVIQMFWLDLAQIIVEVGVSVRYRIRKVDRVIVILKRVGESECVIASLVVVSCCVVLFFVVVLEITHIVTCSSPSFNIFAVQVLIVLFECIFDLLVDKLFS